MLQIKKLHYIQWKGATGFGDMTVPANQKAIAAKKAWAWPWSYALDSKRDLRLDLLRGFCLFAMVIDHIGVFGPDSWLYNLSAHDNFFVSAAEGFFFTSGLVLGLVYVKIIAKEGLGKAVPKILNRAFKLYLVSVALTFITVLLATFTNLNLWNDRSSISIKDPIELIVGTLTLHFAWHGTNILMMYVYLLLAAPLALWGLSLGKWKLVLGVSWLIWLGNLLYPNEFTTGFQSNFPIAAWQALFFTGLLIGYHRTELALFLSKHRSFTAIFNLTIIVSATLLIVLYKFSQGDQLTTFFPSLNFVNLLKDLHDKGNLPLARIVAVFIFFQAFYLLATWLWKPLYKALGWFLLPLGEASLYVTAMHLLVIDLFFNIPGVYNLPYFWYGFALAGSVLLLWFMVKKRFLFSLVPR